MSGYGAAPDIGQVAEAIKNAAEKDETNVPYIRHIDLISGPFIPIVFDDPALFIEPIGSPEEEVGEWGEISGSVMIPRVGLRATHKIKLYPLIKIVSAEGFGRSIIGSGTDVGIVDFVGDLLELFRGNFLGLTGLEPGYAPRVQAADESYGSFEIPLSEEENVFARIATLEWEAKTVVFQG